MSYIIAKQGRPLAPQRMGFGPWWLYNLSSCHSFWSHKVKNEPGIFYGETVWSALPKAYGIQRFSPLKQLLPLAHDYFSSTQVATPSKPSAKEILDCLNALSHLGCRKIDHLRILSRDSIQRRFGKAWGQLWDGLMKPDQATWIWQTHHDIEPLTVEYEFDEVCCDFQRVETQIECQLKSLGSLHPRLRIHSLSLTIQTTESDDLIPPIELSFSYAPLLDQEYSWILKLLKERLSTLRLSAPLWRYRMLFFQATPTKDQQLNLFPTAHQKSDLFHKQLLRFALQMKDLGITVFEPEALPSHLPEESWKPRLPQATKSIVFSQCLRPLAIHPVQRAHETEQQLLERRLKWSERITWFDHNGLRHQRDYFWIRYSGIWKWIFRDEQGLWFFQGVME